MAYPTSLDKLPQGLQNQTDTITGEPDPEYEGPSPTSVGDHAGRHNAAAGAINAIETELGLEPKGGAKDVAARLSALDLVVAAKADSSAVASALAEKASKAEVEGRQPLDSDLTAIAALSTTSFGRELLTLANAAAGRTALALGTAATQATGAFDASGAAAAAQAASQPLDSDLTAIAALSTTEFGRSLLTKANAAALREAAELPKMAVAALAADVGPIKEQTSLQDIAGLDLAIGSSSSEIWRVSYWLIYEAANTTMDIEFGFSVPASCTMRWGAHNNTTNTAGWNIGPVNNTPLAMTAAGGFRSFPTGNTGNAVGINLIALVYGGGTSGNVRIRYAQDVSDAGNLTMLKGSVMEAVRVAA